MAFRQREKVDRFVVGDAVSKPVHLRNWPVDVGPVSGLKLRETVLKTGRPECGLVSLVEEEAPEAKAQLGDHLAGDLNLVVVGQRLPRLGDVSVGPLVEELGWVVVPLARSPLGGVPGRELIVESVAEYHLEVPENLKEGPRNGGVPSVEPEGSFEVATNLDTVRSQPLDAEAPLKDDQEGVRDLRGCGIWHVRVP